MDNTTTHPTPTGSPQTSASRPKRRNAPLNYAARQRIIDAYLDGLSIRAIERTLHHGKRTIKRTLESAGVLRAEDKTATKISRQELVRRRDEGMTPRQIADEFGLDIRTVHKRLRLLGTPAGPTTVELPVQEVVRSYETGATVRQVAHTFQTTDTAVRRALAAGGAVIRSTRPRLLSEYVLADFCRRGFSIAEIVAQTGVSRKSVAKYLGDFGLQAADKRPGRHRAATATLRADQ